MRMAQRDHHEQDKQDEPRTGLSVAPARTDMPASVLVVEDDAVLALLIETTLMEAGTARIRHCRTTQAALEALREERPDAIVLDVHLADRDDGWAIAELVSEVGPRPPRIVFSTGAPQDIPEDIASMGVVLEKPYAPEDLIAAVTARKRGLLSRLIKARS